MRREKQLDRGSAAAGKLSFGLLGTVARPNVVLIVNEQASGFSLHNGDNLVILAISAYLLMSINPLPLKYRWLFIT